MFQTIPEFLEAPFGERNPKRSDLESKYRNLRQKKRIHISGYTTTGESHLVRLSIGSESNEKEAYDVVILFFKEEDGKHYRNFRSYYVKFFSNSPSFIYQYAAIYKQQGFLIDVLVEKMDPDYMDQLPKNPPKISYDKSIYAACRYMEDNQLSSYYPAALMFRKQPLEKFLRSIRDFGDVKFTSELNAIDKQVERELKKKKENDLKRKKNGKKLTTSSTSGIKVKKAGTTTFSHSSVAKSRKVTRNGKKTTTFKK